MFAVCVLTVLGGAAPARADFIASASDPSGDAGDPSAGRDITSVGLVYDREEGSLSGFVRFRGSPQETPSLLTLFAGTRSATGCDGYPAGGFSSDTDEFGASWLRLDTTPAARSPSSGNRSCPFGCARPTSSGATARRRCASGSRIRETGPPGA